MESSFIDELATFLAIERFSYSLEKQGRKVRFILNEHNLIIQPISTKESSSLKTICEYLQYYQQAKYHIFDIFYLYEDKWIFSKESIKTRLKVRLGRANKIFARNCEIISNMGNWFNEERIRRFFNNNHSLGWIKSPYYIGLVHKDNLVGLASFSKPIITKSKKCNDSNDSSNSEEYIEFSSFEWTRYSTLPNTTIIGGMSKILHYFINNLINNELDQKFISLQNYGIEIMSYSDNEWSGGSAYKQLKFRHISDKPPIELYINEITGDRISKRAFLDKERKGIEHKANYYKIYNMGSKKWIYHHNQ